MGEFKHISVTAAGEDDEVIIAGVVDEPATAPAVVAAPENAQAPDSAFEPESSRAGGSSAGSDGAATPAPARPPVRPMRASTREDGFHETTLSDLEGGGMPLMQKIVIIAAVVCIIGALVYYFVAMR